MKSEIFVMDADIFCELCKEAPYNKKVELKVYTKKDTFAELANQRTVNKILYTPFICPNCSGAYTCTGFLKRI